jgi:glycerate-2-kinase
MSNPSPDPVLAIFSAAIEAADPYGLVRKALVRKGDRITVQGLEYDLRSYSKVLVIGAGKAAGGMAVAEMRRPASRGTGSQPEPAFQPEPGAVCFSVERRP